MVAVSVTVLSTALSTASSLNWRRYRCQVIRLYSKDILIAGSIRNGIPLAFTRTYASADREQHDIMDNRVVYALFIEHIALLIIKP